jgi:chitin disaccharide deacetylase
MGDKFVIFFRKLLLKIHSMLFPDSALRRLGYPENTKLLIIHADDLGISSSQNNANIDAMEKGVVNSASIMMPCLKYQEIINYAKIHPEADLGVHLTLTSEWDKYKWGPVLPADEVASIIDSKGYFFENKSAFLKNAVPAEVEKELKAQIDLAIASGIDFTHLDSHMFTALSSREIRNIYLELGKKYGVPVLLPKIAAWQNPVSQNLISVDELYCAGPIDYATGLIDYYRKVLSSLKPGLNCILVHIAYNNKEMQEITMDQVDFGADWRQSDYDFFTGNECRHLLKANNIQLITWREIRDKLKC